jgi:hypothetical protein
LIALSCVSSVSAPDDARADNARPLVQRLQPVGRNSGFHMPGYFVWCGSVIKVGDTYHMFASRWPEGTGFPQGYRAHSEIVRATARKPEGPYTFAEVVIGKRSADKWDSGMAHNPAIYRVGETFVLYYNASKEGSHYRQIGIATAPAVTGPWTRSDRPLELGIRSDANNPAACFEPDGSVKLIWRDAKLRDYISIAKTFRGPYSVANDNVLPEDRFEDFFLFKEDGKYHLVCQDSLAGHVTGHNSWGAHLWSPNGIDGWKKASPPHIYDMKIRWDDGTVFRPRRRERPWLLIENNKITCLFNAVWDGRYSWNQPVPVEPDAKRAF